MAVGHPETTCSGVILCGGLNSRMAGRNKAFLEIGGKSILDRLQQILQPFFKEILLVTRQPELYADRPLRVVGDLYGARSSLTGIHAGLKQAGTPFVFVVPCDTPFVQPALIHLLLNEIEPHVDVIVPHCNDRYQPLCAVYSKRCLPFIEEMLERDDFRIFSFFDHIQLKVIPRERLAAVDPQLRSFFNVNTPKDQGDAQQIGTCA